MDEAAAMSLNCVTYSLAMEIEKKRVEGGGGESSWFDVIECSDGVIRGAVRRDCGDHVELTPIGLLCNQDGIVAFQSRTRKLIVNEPMKYAEPLFSIPSTVMKIPKHLPQDIDITQRNKVLTKIVREAQLQAVYHYFQAHNKRGVSREEIMTFLQKCFKSEEEVENSEEEVKNMCDDLNKLV